jgi:dihydropteroate synthase
MQRLIGARTFDFSREVAVMAIINRTPDSFFDNGSTFALGRAVDAAMVAAGDGADAVDVGAVPFGRGPAVSPAQELDRVLPLVEALNTDRDQRLEGSLAVAVICIIKGARIVRMHDVPAAVAAVRITEAVLGFRKPAYLRHNMDDS